MDAFALKSGDKIVLIGDSITDCGRLEEFPPYGNGYVSVVVNLSNARYPERAIEWVNKGISGDTVGGLASRWTLDVVEEKPDWVSVAIGINDVARDHESKRDLPKALVDFEGHYRQILDRTRSIHARLIISEAFFIAEEDEAQRGFGVEPYNAIIRKLAGEYGARFVPLNQAFRQVKMKRRDLVWTTGDGVHPNPVGHAQIALQILGALGW